MVIAGLNNILERSSLMLNPSEHELSNAHKSLKYFKTIIFPA